MAVAMSAVLHRKYAVAAPTSGFAMVLRSSVELGGGPPSHP